MCHQTGMDSDELSESNSIYDEDSGCENDPLEEVLLGKSVIEVPESFCFRKEIFAQVLSVTTWENELTHEQRERLSALLPNFPENEDEERKKTIKKLFAGENFRFGNPLLNFFEHLKAGYFSPNVALAATAVKIGTYRQYKNQQNSYFFRLLRQVLISRKKLLDGANMLPPDEPVKMQQFTAKPKNAILCERTRLRYFSILQDVREECGELDTSSDDENYPESSPPKITRKHKKQLQILEASLSPEMTRVTSTIALPPGFPGSSHFLNRCLDMIEVSDERYREMLLTHKRRRLHDPNHPELDMAKVDLNTMIAKANLPKRPLLKSDGQTKKKQKPVEPTEKVCKFDSEKLMMDVKPLFSALKNPHNEDILNIANVEKNGDAPLPVLLEKDLRDELKAIKMEMDEEPMCDINFRISPPVPEVPQFPTCFFSLLRDLFCDCVEQKLSASKLEDKVRTWQDGPTAVLHDWIHLHESWSDLVSSALKFLAGDLISILPENFVPFLDYKEKQQQWQWIGSGRDSEIELFALCQHWFDNKDDVSLDMLETCQGSPPPPRVTTIWTVRATTDEEKAVYHHQERIRYQNPHRAFTFKVHGYESVVGPVKGVYGKESGVNKAREHSLLVSDRPPFVTILSLVRDAAARLPNGEGTRAGICELLKDSQYLSPASDQQIHTVVSGALDRLHYEKDPCVKYDVNRKLWIYLHRNRTEGEFERIHQAQAAAAKARKAVQKSKPPKSKVKDVPRAQSSASTNSIAESVAAILKIDVAATISSTSTSHSPRGGASPRIQGSPKQGHPVSNRHLARSLSTPNQAITKAIASVMSESTVVSRKAEVAASSLSSALASTSASTGNSIRSPQHSIVSSILPSFQSDGSNSRPPSQGSVHSLPSPKTVIANVNAAQFVGVGSLQMGPTTEQPISSSGGTSCISVLSVDMKPSSPSFFGQPPVLQPVFSHQTIVTTSILTCAPTTMTSSLASSNVCNMTLKSSKMSSIHAGPSPKVMPGFQTIVIKPDSSLHTTDGLSSLPIISMDEMASSIDSSVLSTNPVVARLLQGSQLLSLSNIVSGNVPNAILKHGPSQIQNLKLQRTNFGQHLIQPSSSTHAPQLHQPAVTDINRIPRLSLVTQESRDSSQGTTLISTLPLSSQASMFTSASPVETRVSAPLKEGIEVKRLTVGSQTHPTLHPSLSDLSQLLDSGGAPNQTITSSGPAMSSSCLPHVSFNKNSQSVVIGTQETLKQLPSTYVMTTPISNPSGIAAQHGLRASAPLNVRALQGIKVIPVTHALGQKNIRSAPLLAHIINPSAGVTLRSGVPGELLHTAHHLKGAANLNVLHGLQSVASASHLIKTSSHTCTNQDVPSSQPFIIQVQVPKSSEGDQNL